MSIATLFIPDITGFTNFVKSTEINHSKHIIQELINLIIKEGSKLFEVAEIEGDAVFFYKTDSVSIEDILATTERIYKSFHTHINQYDHNRICNCGACSTAIELKLKFIVHGGEIDFIQIGKKQTKPFGNEVIKIHRLLKNEIDIDEYLLLTDEFLKNITIETDGFGSNKDNTLGSIPYQFINIGKWRSNQDYSGINYEHVKTHITISHTLDISLKAEDLHELLSNFKFRSLWNKEADDFIYNEDEINQVGTEHLCIIDDKKLSFSSIRPNKGNQILSYGEVLKNPSPLKYLESNFFISRYKNKVLSKLEIRLKANLKNPFQFLLYPLIKWKLSIQSKHIGNEIKNAAIAFKEKISEI